MSYYHPLPAAIHAAVVVLAEDATTIACPYVQAAEVASVLQAYGDLITEGAISAYEGYLISYLQALFYKVCQSDIVPASRVHDEVPDGSILIGVPGG